jgi:hypothetical protein
MYLGVGAYPMKCVAQSVPRMEKCINRLERVVNEIR